MHRAIRAEFGLGSGRRRARRATVRVAPFAWCVALSVLGFAAGAGAQTEAVRAAVRVETYVDDDATTVVRPRASIDAAVGARHRVAASYTADVVTSASIDVVTRASQAIRETRHETVVTGTRVSREGARTSLSYALGLEPDYLSNTARLSHARDLDARRQTNLATSAMVTVGRVGDVADEDFRRRLVTASLGTVLSRVVSPNALVRVSADLSHAAGFQSSAYRTVRLGDWTAYRVNSDDPDATDWVFVGVTATVRERHPDQRFRARVAGAFVQSLGERFALFLEAGTYADSYRILAGDLAAEVRWEPKATYLVRVGGRAYAQSAAAFHRVRYEDTASTNGYVTDDKELGRLRTYATHVALTLPVGPLRLDLRAEANFFHYPQFTLLPEKRALVAAIGLTYRR